MSSENLNINVNPLEEINFNGYIRKNKNIKSKRSSL